MRRSPNMFFWPRKVGDNVPDTRMPISDKILTPPFQHLLFIVPYTYGTSKNCIDRVNSFEQIITQNFQKSPAQHRIGCLNVNLHPGFSRVIDFWRLMRMWDTYHGDRMRVDNFGSVSVQLVIKHDDGKLTIDQ